MANTITDDARSLYETFLGGAPRPDLSVSDLAFLSLAGSGSISDKLNNSILPGAGSVADKMKASWGSVNAHVVITPAANI